jgi:RND family efflux transporter MFP subunit
MKLKLRPLLFAALAMTTLATAAVVALNARASRGEVAAVEPIRPALTVQLVSPQRTELPQAFAAHGSVAAWQEASIGAESPGLRLAAVHVNVGDVVKRGQLLALFAPATTEAELMQLKAAVAESEAQAAEAASNAQRARGLASSGALSAQQINQYLTAEQTALARLAAQRAAARVHELRLAQTRVVAPDDGVISARSATVGAVVPNGQELFRLIRGGRLEWRADVTAAELVQLRPGMAAQVQGADGGRVEGRVRMVAPTVDAHSRTGLVYVDLPASAALKAGMFAPGEFALGRSAALTVPQQALVARDGFSYVFRLAPDQHVVQTRVTPGRRAGERVELLDGLPADAQLVASGAGFLTDGDRVKVVAGVPVQLLADARR